MCAKEALFYCGWLIFLLAFGAPDIAMLIINVQHECSLETEGGESKYVSFGLSTWMFIASALHFPVCSLILSMRPLIDKSSRCSEGMAYRCQELMHFIFSVGMCVLAAWFVIGWILLGEGWYKGVSNEQCAIVQLVWLISCVMFPCWAVVRSCVLGCITPTEGWDKSQLEEWTI